MGKTKEKARENLKNDFDKDTVVELLCDRIDQLEDENKVLRQTLSDIRTEARDKCHMMATGQDVAASVDTAERSFRKIHMACSEALMEEK